MKNTVQRFYDMRLARKLNLLFGFLAVATLIGIVVAEYSYRHVKVGGPVYTAIEQNLQIADGIAKLRANMAFSRATLLGMFVEDDRQARQRERETIDRLANRIDELFETTAGQLRESDHPEAFSSLSTARQAWTSFRDTQDREVIPLIMAGKTRDALALARGIQTTRYDTILSSTKDVVDQVRADVPAKVRKSKQQAELFQWVFALAAGGFILLIVIVGRFLWSSIVRPVSQVSSTSRRMAEGDFSSVRIDVKGKDEIGAMADDLSALVATIGQMVNSIGTSVASLSTSAEQLTATADDMNKNAGEQSVQVKQVADAALEMTQTIADVAQNAGQAAEAAKNSSETATGGKEVVNLAVDGMVGITDTVKEAASNIELLAKSSAQIGEIVTVINGIADQTNLLALNAAIEAARAGEQGRGFAVVADEVRKLAERTAQATKDISQRIGTIREELNKSVSAMRRGAEVADKGKGLAKAASESLTSIVTVSMSAMDMVQRIAAATEEQSATSEEITRNITTISEAVGHTAQSTEQIKEAAHSLSVLSVDIHDKIRWFKVG